MGCGQGQIVGELVNHFEKIIGVDVSVEQISQARARNQFTNVEYQ